MSDYKPKTATYDNELTKDVGYLPIEFEPFQPDPNYSFPRPPVSKDAFPIIVPKKAPPIPDLPSIIERVIQSTWKLAEPSNGAVRDNQHGVIMGNRGGVVTQAVLSETYHAQVRPTTPNISSSFPNKTAIASDWE